MLKDIYIMKSGQKVFFGFVFFIFVSNALAQNYAGNYHFVKNPILPGFNPDPNILRVHDDYYIITSSFEWYPGIPVYHSKNLADWKLVDYVLKDERILNLSGTGNSRGIYAPQISYKDGLFYVVYTNVKTNDWPYVDAMNFVVWSESVHGPWQGPVFLHSAGIDPSLFHDDDGRSWLLTNEIDFRKNNNKSSIRGIVMQEFSTKEKKLKGALKRIVEKSDIEGPHIYKHKGYYYLMVAGGGTSWEHNVSVARSKTLWGPYEWDEQNPVLSSAKRKDLRLQKAGHGSLVETADGDWYMAHLASRPVYKNKNFDREEGYAILGREGCLQKMIWTESGWLRNYSASPFPEDSIPLKGFSGINPDTSIFYDDFSDKTIDIGYRRPRKPIDTSLFSLNARNGFLRIFGGDSFRSLYDQNMIARPVVSLQSVAETCVEFDPESYRQMAGLICYYDTKNFYYLRISQNEEIGKNINVIISDGEGWNTRELLQRDISVEGWDKIYLRGELNEDSVRFYYSSDGKKWMSAGDALDATKLSDDYNNKYGFTGTFWGIGSQDMLYRTSYADFDYFKITSK